MSRIPARGETRVRWFLKRTCLFVAVLVSLGPVTHAQDGETRNELWPEVDVFVPLNEKFRLFFLGSVTKARETRESTEGQVGAHLDYFWKKKWTLRTGYRYGFALGSNDPFKEHRIILEETYHKPLPNKFVLSDRNRQELRWVDGDFSARFRNRAKLEREFQVRKLSLVQYGSAEVFYDTRFSTFNRLRLAVGTQIVFQKRDYWLLNLRRQRVLDIYYLRQNDSRSQPRHVNAIGIAFNIYF
jgi:Protein of unknown function (DUF2490)